MSARPLTVNQQLQLRDLLLAGAICRQTAKGPHQLKPCRTLVIGKLRDFGLADSASVRRRGQSWTEYWLTPAGVTRAKEIHLEHSSSPQGGSANKIEGDAANG